MRLPATQMLQEVEVGELRHGGMTNPQNSYTIPDQYPLEKGTTYFWRVRPRIQGDGTPVAWSNPGSFKTS